LVQLLRQPLDVINDDELATEEAAGAFVSPGVEAGLWKKYSSSFFFMYPS